MLEWQCSLGVVICAVYFNARFKGPTTVLRAVRVLGGPNSVLPQYEEPSPGAYLPNFTSVAMDARTILSGPLSATILSSSMPFAIALTARLQTSSFVSFVIAFVVIDCVEPLPAALLFLEHNYVSAGMTFLSYVQDKSKLSSFLLSL